MPAHLWSVRPIDLQLPLITSQNNENSRVSSQSSSQRAKDNQSEPSLGISSLKSRNFFVASAKGRYKHRHTATLFARTRPLGFLPLYQKVKTWKELGLLLDHDHPPSSLEAIPTHATQVHLASQVDQSQKGEEIAKVSHLHFRVSANVTSKPPVADDEGTDDEEYLNMIAQINMNQYDHEKRQELPMTITSEIGSPQLLARSRRKSARCQHPSKPLGSGLGLEYISFSGQSQLNKRLRSCDIRSSLENEPCKRCALRGTRCSHCIAIRTGGGYIILDSMTMKDSKVKMQDQKGWVRKESLPVVSSLQHGNKGSTSEESGNGRSGSYQSVVNNEVEESTNTKHHLSMPSGKYQSGEKWPRGDRRKKYDRQGDSVVFENQSARAQICDNGIGLYDKKHRLSSKMKVQNVKEALERNTWSNDVTENLKRHDISGLTSKVEGGGYESNVTSSSYKSHNDPTKQSITSSRVGSSRPYSSRHSGNATVSSSEKVPKIVQDLGGKKEVVGSQVNKQSQKIRGVNEDRKKENKHEGDRKRDKSAEQMKSCEKETHLSIKHNKVFAKCHRNDEEEEHKEWPFNDLMKFKSKRDNVKVKDCSLQELQGIDPLDYLAKYCIIDQSKVPHYQQVFDNVDRDEDNLITIQELDFALKAVNYNLISDSEMHYINNVLELAGRYALNFQLFSLVAALSEKVVALDDIVKRLINTMDFEALETKMKKCKELFYLLANDKEGLVTTRDLSVELQAGGLTKEHIDFVTDRLNYEGRGTVQFLDYLTYVPLFIEIHDNINDNPLDFSRNK